MEKKPFYMSRTVWGAFIVFLYVLLTEFGIDLSPYKEIIISSGGLLGVVGLAGKLEKLKK